MKVKKLNNLRNFTQIVKMECFKYYLPISLPSSIIENEPLDLTFTITDRVAGKVIGFNGNNIRHLRKNYDADIQIQGSKNENEREVNITGNDKFLVFQQVLKFVYYK